MKKIKLLIILLILLLPLTSYASTNTCPRDKNNLNIPDKIDYNSSMDDNILSTPCVDANEKIYDFADLLTEEEETNLYDVVTNFIKETNLDLVIVTINNNPKQSAREYADDFFDYNDFSMNGLTFLIDMDNRDYYISTTGEAMLYYNDERIDNILDSSYNNMLDANYNEAILSFINKTTYYYNLGIINTKYIITNDGKIVRKTPWLLLILISLIPTILITLQLALRNKKVKLSNTADDYLKDSKIMITKREDKLINSHTSSVYIPPVSSSNDGNSSGGFHTGSSGTSHGGGGRHF